MSYLLRLPVTNDSPGSSLPVNHSYLSAQTRTTVTWKLRGCLVWCLSYRWQDLSCVRQWPSY